MKFHIPLQCVQPFTADVQSYLLTFGVSLGSPVPVVWFQSISVIDLHIQTEYIRVSPGI